ncbi:unnamed protein product [Clonostachys rosea]|uniref:Uncharacterized protein n=1 Tax=Bionectria ochroleuca TaxID=29856 RepID=A0ABY6U838_BIOOC|nr:unnamed protein product [Clonostachys rosea]
MSQAGRVGGPLWLRHSGHKEPVRTEHLARVESWCWSWRGAETPLASDAPDPNTRARQQKTGL